MHKTLITYFIVLATIQSIAQDSIPKQAMPKMPFHFVEPDIIDKQFVTTIAWMCEEVIGDEDGCAGLEKHITLLFKQEYLTVSVEEVNACGEIIHSNPKNRIQWKWAKNKHWYINLNTEEIKESLLKNITLLHIDGTLIGRKIENNNPIEYRFRKLKEDN